MRFDELLERYDYFLIDLWGVVWDGRRNFPDTPGMIRSLQERGKKFLFLSNCAEHLPEKLVDRLKKAGLEDASMEWLATSGQAMEPWFAEHGLLGKEVYAFGGPDLWTNIERAGSVAIDIPERGEMVVENPQSDTLVVGGMLNFDWKRLTEVVTAVAMGGLRVVLPNPDVVVVQQTGLVRLPPGMILKVIETAVPEVVVDRIGKPYRYVYEYACGRFGEGFEPERTLMIGDSLDTDIRGANNAGLDSLLLGQGVHLGKSRDEIAAMACEKKIFPQFFIPRLHVDGEFEPVDWRDEKLVESKA